MTNRPLDYEHPFARLVPNDIVIPTTEVVKEEETKEIEPLPTKPVSPEILWLREAEKRIAKSMGITGGEQSFSISVKYDANTGTVVDCDIKEKEEVRFGRVEIVKFIETDPKTLEQAMDKIAADFVAEECDRIEQEPQTGWRFLGFDGEEAFVGGVFVPGAVYQIIPGTKYEFYAQFVDEEGDAMHAELVYFEQVK